LLISPKIRSESAQGNAAGWAIYQQSSKTRNDTICQLLRLEGLMVKSLGRLRETRDRLHELPKIVASEGHLEEMTAIDSLLFVAEQETERSLVKIGEERDETKRDASPRVPT
jgi:hypothetical protein